MRAAHVLRALDVAVHDDGEQPAGKMARIVPAVELDLLRLLRVLAVGARRIGIAAVGADQPVHHQLQRRGDLVPVHRRDDHDAVRRHPHRIDVVHPVLRLAERIVRIAGAWPVAERRRGREARLAGMDVAPVFRGEPRQVEHLDLDARLRVEYLARDLHQPPGLRHLAGAGVLGARRAVDRAGCAAAGRVVVPALAPRGSRRARRASRCARS